MNQPLQAGNDQWREQLVALGFSDDGERLTGAVIWTRAGGGQATARVRVTPKLSFPFLPPQVVIIDPGAPLEEGFHLDRDGSLCLWEDEWAVDEAPWRDPRRLVHRVADWLAATAAGWPGDNSCDLERYLQQEHGTFVVYDASALVFDVPVRTASGHAGNVVITGERQPVRGIDSGRRRRRDSGLAWVADIGIITRPLRTWDDVTTALGADAAQVTQLINAGAVSTLLLSYEHGDASGALALRVSHTATGIQMAACESADTSVSTRGLRAGQHAQALADLRIAVVGCGAIGSFAADLLFRCGVRHLTLADGERLRPGNVVRHLAGLPHIGLHKTEAVRLCLAEVDPNVAAVRTTGGLTDLDGAIELIRDHYVVLDATGSAHASSLLATAADRVGRGLGHTVVSVCVQRAGDVIRVDRMPLRGTETYLPALPPLDDTTDLRERGCGSSISPTPPGAVLAAAELAHRFVIDEATRECALPATIVDVLKPQPEPPYNQAGMIRSVNLPRAATE